MNTTFDVYLPLALLVSESAAKARDKRDPATFGHDVPLNGRRDACRCSQREAR